jgi:hypothetical protein
MRREWIRRRSDDKAQQSRREGWRVSLGASLRAAERQPSKADLKAMLTEAALNTAAIASEEGGTFDGEVAP